MEKPEMLSDREQTERERIEERVYVLGASSTVQFPKTCLSFPNIAGTDVRRGKVVASSSLVRFFQLVLDTKKIQPEESLPQKSRYLVN